MDVAMALTNRENVVKYAPVTLATYAPVLNRTPACPPPHSVLILWVRACASVCVPRRAPLLDVALHACAGYCEPSLRIAKAYV
ncbi:hypothetical protein EON67_11705 [archaeon]|nr:MAG: hypothetical protein EON67_11705 [archaeon]